MTDVTITCATPKTTKPAPKGAPEPKETTIVKTKGKKAKLPLPPRKPAQIAASATRKDEAYWQSKAAEGKAAMAADGLDIPEVLRRPAPTKAVMSTAPKERVIVMPKVEKTKTEEQKERSRVRVEKLLAKKSGATKAMPLEGKAALAAIKGSVTLDQLGDTPQGKANSESWNAIPAIAKARSKKAKVAAREAAIDKQARKGTPKAKAVKDDGKTAAIIAMLRKGSTIAAIADALGWEQKSVHGVVSGILRKKMKLKVEFTKTKTGNVYRII